ncbi:MAG: 4-alpha-glucanotransferase [Lachnospiraceae bacterium]|nr:4-alpha-glucanotransferase [Lachnospiraceae bacterium]
MRRAGVLSAVFSLPGRYGVGDFGKCAYEFIDMLSENGIKVWQVLPLNPIGYGHSPYQPYSSEAGDTIYVDLEALYEEGLLKALPAAFDTDSVKVNYESVRAYKQKYFEKAYRNFKKDADYKAFAAQEWVYLYAVFHALKSRNGDRPWNEWPEADRKWIHDRKEDLSDLESAIGLEMFLQYEFYVQWQRILAYAHEKGVLIMGDIPFYVGQDSLDVWGSQDEFLLDPDGYPGFVAGVPPDYFAAEGQRWGNPIYDWDHMEKNGFAFWKNRLLYTAKLYDMIRIDHFRAFDTYWKVPRSCPTAMVGKWIEAPGYAFFDKLLPLLGDTEIIAEDLGDMREEVYKLRDHYNFPGMNVLQFTMLDEKFKIRENMFVYTGTHDNDMIRGWYKEQKPKDQRKLQIMLLGLEEADKARIAREEKRVAVKRQLIAEARYDELKLLPKGEPAFDEDYGINLPDGTPLIPEEEISWAFIRYAMKSEMETCITPWQDLLGLGTEARVNVPGIVNEENWRSKMTDYKALKAALKAYGEEARWTKR